jgi:formylglycine-generating enzyme required for sulfatase activity
MEGSKAGWQIIATRYRAGNRMVEEIVAGFIPLVGSGKDQDTGTFAMGEEDNLVRVTLSPYRLHRYCVTNVEFERFDPRHRKKRWGDERHPAVEGSGNASADGDCPVVTLSWYDAWCYAKWLGWYVCDGQEHEVTLPSEAQWEYACRAGQTTPFTFDDSHDGLTCTADYCNFDGNYPFGEGAGKGDYRQCTLPVDGTVPSSWSGVPIVGVKGWNRWGLYQLHGNVWEWCADWFNSTASARVLRGGSWDDGGWHCRSAFRGGGGPGGWNRLCGVRRAAAPVVGAQQGKRGVERRPRSRPERGGA